MTLYKRAVCSSRVSSSSSVYVCNSCDYTEMVRTASLSKKCPKCGENLEVVSSEMEDDLELGQVDQDDQDYQSENLD